MVVWGPLPRVFRVVTTVASFTGALLACVPAGPLELVPDISEIVLRAAQGDPASVTITLSGAAPDSDLAIVCTETWLTCSSTHIDGVPAIDVTATSRGLSQGDYSASIEISAEGYSALSVPVALTITAPQLRFDPPSLSYQLSWRETRDVEVLVTGSLPPASVAATSDADWLTLTSAPASGAQVITVHLDAGELPRATHTAVVRASEYGFVDAELLVSVSVEPDCAKTVEINFQDTSSFDLGWTGHSFNQIFPSSTIMLNVDCSAGDTCDDSCTITGLANNNVVPGRPSNRRCRMDTAQVCQGNSDCAVGDTCSFFLAPIEAFAGGNSKCVVPYFDNDLDGTVDLVNGSAVLTPTSLTAVIQSLENLLHPCPLCQGGLCSRGLRQGLACEVHGTTVFGSTSLDCPSGRERTMPIQLPTMASDTQTTWTLGTEHKGCPGKAGAKCFCSTCNTAAGEPCSTDADCPMSGGAPGVCGGRRCRGGTDDGTPCSSNGQCSTDQCNRPGALTQPNWCDVETDGDGLAIPGTDVCDATTGTGTCLSGPADLRCSVSRRIYCTGDGDCPFGESCVTDTRACWADSGIVGGQIATDLSLSGVASRPAFGALTCLAPASSSAINDGVGLPGPMRLKLYTDVTVHD